MMQRHMPMGYKMVNGTVELHEEQAAVVRRIFAEYIAGKSMLAIAKELTAAGVPNANNIANWNHGSVGRILQNVRYRGDEFYPGLIDVKSFEKAQERRITVEKKLGRTEQINVMRNQTAFSGKIRCGECGEIYKKYIEHAGKPSEKTKWKCKNYIYQNQVKCRNHFFSDDELRSIFIDATNQLIRQKWRLGESKPQVPPKMTLALREIETRIKELEQDEDYSNPELPALIIKRAQLYYAGAKVYDHPTNTEKIKDALSGLGSLTEFDEELFQTIIKQMTVYKGTKVEVEFINGIVIDIPIEAQGKDGSNGTGKKDGSNHTASNEIRQACESGAKDSSGSSLL